MVVEISSATWVPHKPGDKKKSGVLPKWTGKWADHHHPSSNYVSLRSSTPQEKWIQWIIPHLAIWVSKMNNARFNTKLGVYLCNVRSGYAWGLWDYVMGIMGPSLSKCGITAKNCPRSDVWPGIYRKPLEYHIIYIYILIYCILYYIYNIIYILYTYIIYYIYICYLYWMVEFTIFHFFELAQNM